MLSSSVLLMYSMCLRIYVVIYIYDKVLFKEWWQQLPLLGNGDGG